MTSSAPLDITVVYDASGRRRPPAKPVRQKTTRAPRARAASASIGVVVLGFFNWIAAAGFCYATWWPIEEYIVVNSAMRTPFQSDLDLDAAAAAMFGTIATPGGAPRPLLVPPLRDSAPSQAESTPAKKDAFAKPEPPKPVSRFDVRTSQLVIGITATGWLVLATAACCALAAAGGAGWGRAGGKAVRVLGTILALAAAALLVWKGFELWTQVGKDVSPARLRPMATALAGLAAATGLALGRNVRGLSRLASILIILSAFGSVAGLYLGHLAGVIEAGQATALFLAIVFVAHSLWGWFLLFFAPKVTA